MKKIIVLISIVLIFVMNTTAMKILTTNEDESAGDYVVITATRCVDVNYSSGSINFSLRWGILPPQVIASSVTESAAVQRLVNGQNSSAVDLGNGSWTLDITGGAGDMTRAVDGVNIANSTNTLYNQINSTWTILYNIIQSTQSSLYSQLQSTYTSYDNYRSTFEVNTDLKLTYYLQNTSATTTYAQKIGVAPVTMVISSTAYKVLVPNNLKSDDGQLWQIKTSSAIYVSSVTTKIDVQYLNAGTLANTVIITTGNIYASGTASASTFLNGNGSWGTPGGGSDPTIKACSNVDYVHNMGSLSAVNFTTVTTCGLSLAANTTYQFRFDLIFQSTLTTVGCFPSLTYSVAPFILLFQTYVQNGINATAATWGSGRNKFQGVTGTGVDINDTNLEAQITGVIQTIGATILYPVFRSELINGKITIKKGSAGWAYPQP